MHTPVLQCTVRDLAYTFHGHVFLILKFINAIIIIFVGKAFKLTKDVANLHSRRKSNAGVHGKDGEYSTEDDVG